MREILERLIADSLERRLPDLTDRQACLPVMQNKAAVVTGMRRTGKTWFCFQRMKQLLASKVESNRLLYLNFEDDRILDFSVNDFQLVLDIYYSRFPANRERECFFFFDEIQRIPQWEVFIRRVLDSERIQMVLTGSSATLLSREIASCLRGRSLTTEIFPFSFPEFLQYHKVFEAVPEVFSSRTISSLQNAIEKYKINGGFPEVQDIEPSLRTEILQGYIDAVLLKDIVERHRISNILPLKHLVNHVLNAPGGLFSVNKFHNTLQSMGIACAKNSLYEYLDYLADAYLIFKVPQHTRSAGKRQVLPSKYYSIDTGLLQAMMFRRSDNNGHFLETMVYLHLRRKGLQIEFIRTADGYEIDFAVTDPISGSGQLVQVCYNLNQDKTLRRELRAISQARKELGFDGVTLVTWNDEAELPDGTKVIPAWKFLLQ